MHRAKQALVVCAVLSVATGCSASVGSTTPVVDHTKLATSVSDQLTKSVGQKPDKVTCPDDLKGTKGAKVRCMLTAGNQTYGVTVTTTSVEDKNVKFAIKVDDKPQT